MFNNTAIDISIGLIFIFLLYSLLATVIQEFIARVFSLRAYMLVKAIRLMLDGRKQYDLEQCKNLMLRIIPNALTRFVLAFMESLGHFRCPLPKGSLSRAFYEDPAIKLLAESVWNNKPSYFGAETFSTTLISILRGNYDGTTAQITAVERSLFPGNIIQVNGKRVKIKADTLKQLQGIYTDSAKDIDKFKILLEKWFTETMDRTTGWYKRQTQLILFITGFVLAIIFNADVIAIVNILSTNRTAREQLVNMAVAKTQAYETHVNNFPGQPAGQNAAADTGKHVADSIFINTYKEVLGDVKSAGEILGLGWVKPGKDTTRNNDSLINAVNNAALTDSTRQKIAQLILEDKRKVTPKKKYYFWDYKLNPIQDGPWHVFIGWCIMAFAVCLGSTFWFDLLTKVVRMRAAGAKPDDSGSGAGNNKQADNNQPSPVQRVG